MTASSFVQQINQHPAPIDQPDNPPRLPDNADNHIPAILPTTVPDHAMTTVLVAMVIQG